MENKKMKESFISTPIFSMEFRKRFKSLSVWTLILAGFAVLIIAMYPLIGDMYADIINQMGEELSGFMAGLLVAPNNIAEYYAIEGGQMFVLVGVLYSAMLAINIMREDLQNENAEFLYSKPVSKRQVFRTKFLVLICNILLINIVLTVLAFITMGITDGGYNFNIGNFFLLSAVLAFIMLALGVSFFSVTSLLKRKIKISHGIGLSMLFYILFIFKDLHKDLEFLKYATPYSLIGSGVMAEGLAAISLPIFIIWLVIPVSLLITAYTTFKDTDVL